MRPFLCSALSPVHPAAFPASLAGDPLRREDDEKRWVLQVMIRFQVVTQIKCSLCTTFFYYLNLVSVQTKKLALSMFDHEPTLMFVWKPSQDLIQVKAQSGAESRRGAERGWGCSDREGQSEGGPHLPVLWRSEWISDLLVQETKELLNFVFSRRSGSDVGWFI